MRIVIVTGPFLPLPPAPCGAVERIWSDLAAAFVCKGHRVHIIAREDGASPRQERRPDGVRITRVGRMTSTTSLPVNLAKDFVYAMRALRRVPHCDVLVTNTFWLPVLAGLLRRDVATLASIARMPKGQMRLYARSGVACLCAVSRPVADAIVRECPAAKARVRVVPNPIDTRVFTPCSGTATDGKRLLYAGRIHPEKGLDLLLDAHALLLREDTMASLHIAGAWRTEDGGGGDAYMAGLRRRAGEIGRVTFQEPIYDRGEFRRFLSSGSAFCYPSLAEKGESFGVAPLEAMACGTPAVVSALPVFREFIRPGHNGEVFDHRAPDAAQQLADAVRRVRAPGAQHWRFGVDTARQFSIDAIANRYLDVFTEIAKGRRP